MATIDDPQLIQRAANGDSEAFSELVRRYRDMVYGYCYHRTGSFEDARDLAQETFLRAYTRLSQVRDHTKLGAWLRKIADNLCSRWASRQREIPVDDLPPQQPPEDPPHAALVREALASLPENERLAVVLHYVNGYSYSDIAHFLDISKPAVRGRLYRGRDMLRTEMLKMTENAFDENRLDEDFVIDTVRASIQEAADAYNIGQDRNHSRIKTDEAARFLDGDAALQITDPVVLGNALMGLATREDVLGEPDRARAHRARAKSLFEEVGDQDGIEALRADEAYDHLKDGDFAAAHKGYSAAAGYRLHRRAQGEEGNDYDYVAAVRALESLGLETERSRVVAFQCGVSVFESQERCLLASEYTRFGFTDADYPRNRPGPPPCPAPLPLVLVRLEPAVGDDLKFVNGDGRAEESVLESLSDGASTPAGVFTNCARVDTRIFASNEYAGSPVAHRTIWLAPGAGIVRIQYEQIGQSTDSLELVSYSTASSNDLLPLAVGNWWKWRWAEGEETYGFRTEFYRRIEEQLNESRFVAAQYWFCVKR